MKKLANKYKERFFLSKVEDGTISVYRDGKVFNNKTGRWIGYKHSSGYQAISMRDKDWEKSGKRSPVHNILVHRLMWLVFKGRIPQGIEVNHKDADVSHNHIDNFELVTSAGNQQHARAKGLFEGTNVGEKNPNSHFTDCEVLFYRGEYDSGGMKARQISDHAGVTIDTARAMLYRMTYKHLD